MKTVKMIGMPAIMSALMLLVFVGSTALGAWTDEGLYMKTTDQGVLVDSTVKAYLNLDRGTKSEDAWLGFKSAGAYNWLIGTGRTGYNSDLSFCSYAYNTWTTPLYLEYATGNIGIGTTTPGKKLTIETDVHTDGIRLQDGNGNYRALLCWNSAADADGGAFLTMRNNSGHIKAKIRSYETDGVQAYFTAGNFAIGTKAPEHQFEAWTSDTGEYAGCFYSSLYRGIYASGKSNYYAGYFENPSGSSGAGLYVDGNMTVTGAKTGFVVDIALNDGPEYLETGDVVVITGYDEPVVGEIPVVRARIAGQAGSTAVAGVVDQPFSVPEEGKGNSKVDQLPKPSGKEALIYDGTAIGPGEYFTMVTLGSFKAIKVDASYGAIEPGDLLISSETPGCARRAENPGAGTIVGKALESLPSGTGVIKVLVTLH